jgi:hypothetical protein
VNYESNEVTGSGDSRMNIYWPWRSWQKVERPKKTLENCQSGRFQSQDETSHTMQWSDGTGSGLIT